MTTRRRDTTRRDVREGECAKNEFAKVRRARLSRENSPQKERTSLDFVLDPHRLLPPSLVSLPVIIGILSPTLIRTPFSFPPPLHHFRSFRNVSRLLSNPALELFSVVFSVLLSSARDVSAQETFLHEFSSVSPSRPSLVLVPRYSIFLLAQVVLPLITTRPKKSPRKTPLLTRRDVR